MDAVDSGERDQGTLSPVFAGRQRELRWLLHDAERDRTSACGAVIVAGAAGVGKSRLLREYTARSPLGRVVTGGCLELGVDGLPYAPFVTVLRELLAAPPEPVVGTAGTDQSSCPARGGSVPDRAEGEPVIDRSRPLELARLLPELGPPPDSREEGRARLFEEILTVLTRASTPHGLAVVIEDLHWADRSTRDLLVFLLRNLYRGRLQMLLSYRTDDLHRAHPLRRLLPELERLPSVTRIDLGPLDRADVGRQAEGIRGAALSAADLQRVYARSGGNPLFVESMVNAGGVQVTGVPDGPRELLLGAIRPLSPEVYRLVRIASVGGERVEHALLAAVARATGGPESPGAAADEEDLEDALRRAVDANVLRTEGDGYAFRHALLAEVVYDELLPGERSRLHCRYAKVLAAGVAGIPEGGTALRIAHHSFAAHDIPHALTWAAKAAADAASRGLAAHEHLAMVERILDLWDQVPDAAERVGADRADTLYRASRAAFAVGEQGRAAAYATEGLRELTGGTVPEPGALPGAQAERVARLLHARGEANKSVARDDSLGDLWAATRILPADHPARAEKLVTLSGDLMLRGDFAESLPLAEEALRLAREVGDHYSEADALITIGTLITDIDERAGEAERMFREAIDIGLRIDRTRVVSRAYTNMLSTMWTAGRAEDATAVAAEHLAWAESLPPGRIDLGLPRLAVLTVLGLAGRLHDARRACFEAARTARGTLVRSRISQEWATIERFRGELDTAENLLDEAGSFAPPGAARATEAGLGACDRAMLDLARERLPEALSHLRPYLRLTGADALPPYHRWRLLLAAGMVHWTGWWTGRTSAAERAGLRAELDECARAPMRGPAPAVFLRAHRGAVAALLDEGDDRVALWEEAVEGMRPLGRVLETAELLIFAGATAGRLGDRDRARAWLDEARETLAGTGAALLTDRCEAYAVSLGLADRAAPWTAGPRGLPVAHRKRGGAAGARDEGDGAVAVSGGPALTPREHEVLLLLERGRTNREIAAELVISVKTVSVHVSNVLGKLGVGNRNAAAVRARELGIGPGQNT